MRILAFAVASAFSMIDVAALAAGGRGESCSSYEDCDTSLACVSGACIPPTEYFQTSAPELAARLACTLQPVTVLNGEARSFDVSVNGEPCARPIRNAIPLRISTADGSVTIAASVPFGVSAAEVQRALVDVRVELEGRLAASRDAPRDKRSSAGLILGGIGVIVLGLGTTALGGLGIAWGATSHSCTDRGCSSPPLELAGAGVAGLVVGAVAIVGGIYMIVVGAKARPAR